MDISVRIRAQSAMKLIAAFSKVTRGTALDSEERRLIGEFAQMLRQARPTMQPLTPHQHALLAYLHEYITANGYAPNFKETAARFGYRSESTVHEHLVNLERKGYIKRSYNEARSIEIVNLPVDLTETVAG